MGNRLPGGRRKQSLFANEVTGDDGGLDGQFFALDTNPNSATEDTNVNNPEDQKPEGELPPAFPTPAPVAANPDTGATEAEPGYAKAIRMIWRTRHTEDTSTNRELYVKTTLRELIIYIVFLVVVCIVTFGMTNTTMYYYTKVMSDLFLDSQTGEGVSFRSMSNVAAFWKFMQGPLVDGLFWEDPYKEKTPGDTYIYYENKLLGLPRLRQQTVVINESCIVHERFESLITGCYAEYSASAEDTASFGPTNKLTYTAWDHKSEEDLGGSSHYGLLNKYGGGGYVQNLPVNKEAAVETLQHLFDNRWIKRGTRAVFIDFSVYNANINLFCVIRLLVEFPPTGGALPSWTFRTVKLIRYVTSSDYAVLFFEFIFVLFIIYYIGEEVLEIKRIGIGYLTEFWNVVDLAVIFISSVCILFNVYRTIAVDSKLKDLLDKPNDYPDFEGLSFWENRFSNAIAVATFLAWIKIFKYISFNKTMTQLSSTLGRCAKDLVGFFIMFLIIFIAFTQLGYLLFGSQVKDFSSFINSFFTLFRIILGDFDFEQLQMANRILGPIFFMLFVFFVFFVLINMFLAIINDTYSEVKSDMASLKNEFEIADYFKRGYDNILSKLSTRDKISEVQKALEAADINKDDQIDLEEWRQELKTRGYADADIDAMFAKYDLDGNQIIDAEEKKKILESLAERKAQLEGEINKDGKLPPLKGYGEGDSGDESGEDVATRTHGPNATYEEFMVLARRVDRLEHAIGSLVAKLDAVLVRLEAMDGTKVRTRARSIQEVDKEQMKSAVKEEMKRWETEEEGHDD